jgi:hypothetical protein
VNRTKIALFLCASALIGTNAWWAYRVLDAGISQTYLRASFDTANDMLKQTLAILPVVARPDALRSEVIAAAQRVGASIDPFEKDGYTWVGLLGLKFNEQGRFVYATSEVPEPK